MKLAGRSVSFALTELTRQTDALKLQELAPVVSETPQISRIICCQKDRGAVS
jgi:hypothetical protein